METAGHISKEMSDPSPPAIGLLLLEMGTACWLWLLCFCLAGGQTLEEPPCRLLGARVSGALEQPGDVVIGGLFPIHLRAPEPDTQFTERAAPSVCLEWGLGRKVSCRCVPSFDMRSYRWLQTMIFAVEEINRNAVLLPNFTLGYVVADSCLAEGPTLGAALSLVTGWDQGAPQPGCEGPPRVPVIVGDARSSGSIAIARTLGVFNIPLKPPVDGQVPLLYSQVSYFASCACLSDHRKFPTFFRTVPNDVFQAQAMAHMLRLLGWTWVGVVAGDDDYGRTGIQLLLQELRSSEVCVAFSQLIPKAASEARLAHIVRLIKESTARVVVTFAIDPDMHALLREVVRQNITDKQWVATEAWVTSTLLSAPQNLAVLGGTVGLALRRAEIPGLKAFLTRLRPDASASDPFVREFWEMVFECSLDDTLRTSISHKPQCSGTERLEQVENLYSDVSQLRVSYNVYKAVYAIAGAVHNMLACRPGEGPFEGGRCPDVPQVQPWQVGAGSILPVRAAWLTQPLECSLYCCSLEPFSMSGPAHWKLLHYLSAANFTTPVGETIHFDENGDPMPSYDIINWQRGPDGLVKFVKVGQFDAVDGSRSTFHFDVKRVVWGGGQIEVPVSLCSKPCPRGTWRALQKGKPVCCFDCLPCADGEVSNTTGSTECTKCPEWFWPNALRTECVRKKVEFLSLGEMLGVILALLSLSGAVLTVAVVAVFFHHRHTPLVRANNSELSFLLLLALALCFLCALAFVGRPSPWSCRLRHTLFGISFVLCISCVLCKTLVVLVAFRATLPGSNAMRFFGLRQQRLGLSLCTLLQKRRDLRCPPPVGNAALVTGDTMALLPATARIPVARWEPWAQVAQERPRPGQWHRAVWCHVPWDNSPCELL
ncbi:extracellular calcium-sensing receptor-like [Scleropages formosus]|uniref:Extracellular calcium-sensing receptor-like n=1 Tax=Scleropages formosus TaxID=113540 RepID=A0A0P7Z070_SCLFO|nr:extracellular calcium-sensing receptor-like [Scleropages formosus]